MNSGPGEVSGKNKLLNMLRRVTLKVTEWYDMVLQGAIRVLSGVISIDLHPEGRRRWEGDWKERETYSYSPDIRMSL